jgi:hypothetical protein
MIRILMLAIAFGPLAYALLAQTRTPTTTTTTTTTCPRTTTTTLP